MRLQNISAIKNACLLDYNGLFTADLSVGLVATATILSCMQTRILALTGIAFASQCNVPMTNTCLHRFSYSTSEKKNPITLEEGLENSHRD